MEVGVEEPLVRDDVLASPNEAQTGGAAVGDEKIDAVDHLEGWHGQARAGREDERATASGLGVAGLMWLCIADAGLLCQRRPREIAEVGRALINDVGPFFNRPWQVGNLPHATGRD